MAKELYVTNLENKQTELFICTEYIESYIEGFIEGENEFLDKWNLKPDTLYGNSSKVYAQNILKNYSITGIKNSFDDYTSGGSGFGWKQQAISIPLIITHSIIKESGFYAGLVSKVEELMRIHKSLFVNPEDIKNQAPEPEKEYISLRRVYSFILAIAFHKGHSEIQDLGKRDFENYISKMFPDAKSPATIYQTVRSTYKNESNFLLYTSEMEKNYCKDYDYAMKIFNNYFSESMEN